MDRFLIAPYESGLETALKSWMIPDDAFSTLENAYVWRGKVRKRFGGTLMSSTGTAFTKPLYSRLRINLKGLAGGAAAGTVPGAKFKVGQQFSVGDAIFTVFDNTPGPQQMKRTDGVVGFATYDVTNGNYDIQNVAAANGTPVFFYPLDPVMGLYNYKSGPINNQPSYGFDTQFAYVYGNGWARTGAADGAIWHGSDSDFFGAENWRSNLENQTVMFVTNFHVTNPNGAATATDDPMWRFNTNLAPQWLAFSPEFKTTHERVFTCKIIVCFKDRLLLLNTIEQDAALAVNSAYTNRCRYSHNGSPLSVTAFLQVNQLGYTGGGYTDAPTKEQIVSAKFIKDRLIVFFERSTWELAYTNNDASPFVWQRLNMELGSESTYSTVPFDKVIYSIGNTGIHGCNGSNVERIDSKIADTVFQIRNFQEGPQRTHGIRDFFTEMVYWTYPRSNQSSFSKYPSKVLTYNYKNGSWALNDDCITCFGYYEQQTGLTWADLTMPWSEWTAPWNSGTQQALHRQIIAGNQQGYVFIVDADTPKNAPVMSITNVVAAAGLLWNVTIIDHNLEAGDYIYIDQATGLANFNDSIYQVKQVVDKDTIVIAQNSLSIGSYYGGGQVTRVSAIRMNTKQFNPYITKGKGVYVAKIDFAVETTDFGEITVDYASSTSGLLLAGEAQASGCNMGTNVLETFPYPTIPFEVYEAMHWHPVYFQSEGSFIQLFFYMSDAQMRDKRIAFTDFVLNAMMLYTSPARSYLG